MAILEDLKRISIKIDIAIEIHLRERLHWGPLVASVLLLGVYIFEAQVKLDGPSRVLYFVIDSRTEGGDEGPIHNKYGQRCEKGQ